MRTRAPSPATIKLLATLRQQPEAFRYGYELMKATELDSGTLYPILARLHERGLLQAQWRTPLNEGRPARQAYKLTAAGAAYALEHASKARAKPLQRRKPA